MRSFAYLRVSTEDQTCGQQLQLISNAGFTIEENRVISEVVSGGVSAMQRSKFKNLVENKLEAGDTLVIAKLDRLGRDNIDVQQVVSVLSEKGIKLHILDLPVSDLSSSHGKLMLQMFSAFAEFERNRIGERTKEALAKKKIDGVKLGRPQATKTTEKVKRLKASGLSQSKTALELGLSLVTVKRHWNKAF